MSDAAPAISDAAIADAYTTLFDGLTQLGPTTDATRRAVLALVRDRLPAAPVVADLGCGAGSSTLFLARALAPARLTAVDLHAGFLARLAAQAQAEGLAVATLEADMARLPLAEASQDLLWSDSAIYNIGRQAALAAWRPLLKPSGVLAFSDVVWTTDQPPEAAGRFWAGEYPAMASEADVAAEIAAACWTVLAVHRAPPSDWQAYYAPLRDRVSTLRPGATPALAQVLDGTAREIAVFDSHGDSYASVWFVATPGQGSERAA